MAKLQCEFCGSFIEDTLEYCDVCGGLNKNHKRFISGTPKTIEELKLWYIQRKLPPEEVTRFFIGKNIKEPKAFGIYKESGEFIVYKNKANGQRAIRYKGTDEQYAVNELYMKIKEEILRQKNLNFNKKSNNLSNNKKKHKRTKKMSFMELFGIGSIIFTALIILLAVSIPLFTTLNPPVSEAYFVSDAKEIYFREENEGNKCDWWVYDKELNKWEFYDTIDKKKLLSNVDEDDIRDNPYHIAAEFLLSERDIDIYNSKEFIDAGNHKTPKMSYYKYDKKVYYYLDDVHSKYGKDNSGWYILNDDGWEYYCSDDDKDVLGEELWYFNKNYTTSELELTYDWTDDLSDTWNQTNFKSFEDTEWYESYQSNEKAYQEDMERQEQEDNDDKDYDWDDDNDWDNDNRDWDSDW